MSEVKWAEMDHPDLPQSIHLLGMYRTSDATRRNRASEIRDGETLLQEVLRVVSDRSGWTLVREEGCKPLASLSEERAWITLAHSTGLMTAAASFEFDVGIDLEPLNRSFSFELGHRMIHRDEWRWWDTTNRDHLLQLWTLKEAALKQLGSGLRLSMNRVRVEPVSGDQYHIVVDDQPVRPALSWVCLDHWVSLVWGEEKSP